MSKRKGIYVGLEVDGFCCEGYGWRVFAIGDEGIHKGVVYSECDNPECQNFKVFVPSLGDLDTLRTRLTMLGPEVYPL